MKSGLASGIGRLRVLMTAALALLACGCQSSPLAGTRWVVTRVDLKAEADPNDIANVETVLVDFAWDGTLQTLVVREDGTTNLEESEAYEAKNGTLVVRRDGGEQRMAYEFVGDALHLSTPKYFVELERRARPAVSGSNRSEPAMFRPNDLAHQEMRRVTYMRR